MATVITPNKIGSIIHDPALEGFRLEGNDVAGSPGNNKYYGTDELGTKGFHTLSDLSGIDTLTASGETNMRIWFTGAVPVLSKTSDGNYLLVVPTESKVESFIWKESGATFTSNAVKLTIRDTDGESLYGVYSVISDLTGDEFGQNAGIVIRQTEPIAGDVLVQFPNVESLAGDFIIVRK